MEVRAIYARHTVKSQAEVDTILINFQGREEELLLKAKSKYLPT